MWKKLLISFGWWFGYRPEVKEAEVLVEEKLPRAKSPDDMTLTSESTQWTTSESFCPSCLNDVDHNEYVEGFCKHCRTHQSMLRFGRSYRKIFDGESWLWQYKFKGYSDQIKQAIKNRGGVLVVGSDGWEKYVLTDNQF